MQQEKDLQFLPIQETDLEWARAMHNDPEVLQMLTDPHEVQPAEQQAWFVNLQRSRSSQRLVVWDRDTRIGLVRIDQIDRYNNSVCLGLDIDRPHRGKGYARPIYNEMLRRFFSSEKMNRVWLLVAEYNQRAFHIYKSLGFLEEGRHRKALFKDGEYWDYILMGILRQEFTEKANG